MVIEPTMVNAVQLPLDRQPWFHGTIDRKIANKLLLSPGDFLVRESK